MALTYLFLRTIRKKRERTNKNKEKSRTKYIKSAIGDETKDLLNKNPKKCRICFKNGSVPIFSTIKSQDISEAVKIFGDIEIKKEDKFPKYLCDSCYSLLQGAILFRNSAKKADSVSRHDFAEYKDDIQASAVTNDSYSDFGENSINKLESKLILYKCKLCKLDFKSYQDYLMHKNSKKHRNIRIECPICYGLLTVQLYKKHLARHQSATHLVCDICGKLYRKDNLVRHLQLHSLDLPFQCQLCPYRGRFMESLKIHMRTHTGEKPFSCDSCDLRFLTRSNLNRHLLTHKKEKPFKCIECGRGFYTQRDSEIHFKSDHTGVKDFCCSICANKYGTRKALMRHELRVHKRSKMAKGRMPLYLQAEYNQQIISKHMC